MREAHEQLVDGRRRERTVPVEGEAEKRRIVRRNQVALKRRALGFRLVMLVRHAPEEPIVVRRVCVDFEIALVDPLLVRRRRDQVVVVAGPVGQRVQRLVREDGPRDRTEPADGDEVAGEGLPRLRVADRHGNARKVPTAPRLGRDAPDQLARTVPDEALVIAKEEDLVSHDRPADRAAEDVL